MKSISVFCGSSPGSQPAFMEVARQVGEALARRDCTVVYGGAAVGLMGSVADGALSQGGSVIGVLPTFLNSKEIAHQNLTELIMVDSMHERKMKMNEYCDGVIALPGGFGTLEEVFEMLTWAQLGLHQKPIGVLNVESYYDNLFRQLDDMVSHGFLKLSNREMVIKGDTIDQLLDDMVAYEPHPVPKWIKSDEV